MQEHPGQVRGPPRAAVGLPSLGDGLFPGPGHSTEPQTHLSDISTLPEASTRPTPVLVCCVRVPCACAPVMWSGSEHPHAGRPPSVSAPTPKKGAHVFTGLWRPPSSGVFPATPKPSFPLLRFPRCFSSSWFSLSVLSQAPLAWNSLSKTLITFFFLNLSPFFFFSPDTANSLFQFNLYV